MKLCRVSLADTNILCQGDPNIIFLNLSLYFGLIIYQSPPGYLNLKIYLGQK